MLYSFLAPGVGLIRARALAAFSASLALTLVLGGCASGSLTKIESTGALPQELPKELQQKFEVKEVPSTAPPNLGSWPGSPQATPTSLETARSGHGRKRRKRKGKAEAQAAAPAPAFAYPSRRSPKDPIQVGEQMVFDITYFGMQAGKFTVDVLPFKEIDDRKVYHIRGVAESSKVFNLFYRLNDMVETFLDYDGLFSHRFHILLDESKQQRDALELYDSEKKQTFYWNRWNHKDRGYQETKEFDPIESFSQDSFSALFYLRTLPLAEGKVYTFPVVSEGKSWEAVVTVVRRETIDSPLGKVQAVVIKPETRFQGVLQKKGDSYLWLTDDDRRIVLRLDAKVRIGTVVAKLSGYRAGEQSDKPAMTESK